MSDSGKVEKQLIPAHQLEQVAAWDLMHDEDQDHYGQNVFSRKGKEDQHRQLLCKHKAWLELIRHEFPMPQTEYRIGVYMNIHRFGFMCTNSERLLQKRRQIRQAVLVSLNPARQQCFPLHGQGRKHIGGQNGLQIQPITVLRTEENLSGAKLDLFQESSHVKMIF